MTAGPLCVCGLDTVLMTVLAVIVAVMYGELVARLAVRRASPDHARHRVLTEARHQGEQR